MFFHNRNPIKLTDRQKSALHKLLDSRVVDEVLDADEQETVRHRRTLLVELGVLRRGALEESPVLEGEVRIAADRVAAAKRELDAAEIHERDARQRHHLSLRAKPIGAIERELREGADARIRNFRHYAEGLEDHARGALSSWPEGDGSWGNRLIVKTNVESVTKVRAMLRECVSETHALELKALSYGEVTQALCDMCERIAAPLAELRLNPPQVANDGEIGAPVPFLSRTQWLVDEVEEVKREKVAVQVPALQRGVRAHPLLGRQ